MRFMVLVKATQESEAGVMPTTEQLTAMGKFNEEMVRAGVMLAGEGLHPSSKGARIRYTGEGSVVTEGPFAASDLVAGFWRIEVKSKDEAIAWMKCAPFGAGSEIELPRYFRRRILARRSRPNCARRKSGCARNRRARNSTASIIVIARSVSSEAIQFQLRLWIASLRSQ